MTTLRILVKSPGYLLACIVVLGLGIGGNAAIFSLIDAVIFEPLPYPVVNRLVFVWQRRTTLSAWRSAHRSHSATRHMHSFSVVGEPEPDSQQPPMADFASIGDDYFKTFDVPIVAGRAFSAADVAGALPAAIVNRSFARKFLHGGNPVGQHNPGPGPQCRDRWLRRRLSCSGL